MPQSIPFSVVPAVRTGTLKTTPRVLPAGYVLCHFELNISNTTDYENPANAVAVSVMYDPTGGTNFSQYYFAGWSGGRTVNKTGQVDPPPVFEVGLDQIPAGSNVFVQFDITGTFSVGLQNGLIS